MKPVVHEEPDRVMLDWFDQQQAQGYTIPKIICVELVYTSGMEDSVLPLVGWHDSSIWKLAVEVKN